MLSLTNYLYTRNILDKNMQYNNNTRMAGCAAYDLLAILNIGSVIKQGMTPLTEKESVTVLSLLFSPTIGRIAQVAVTVIGGVALLSVLLQQIQQKNPVEEKKPKEESKPVQTEDDFRVWFEKQEKASKQDFMVGIKKCIQSCIKDGDQQSKDTLEALTTQLRDYFMSFQAKRLTSRSDLRDKSMIEVDGVVEAYVAERQEMDIYSTNNVKRYYIVLGNAQPDDTACGLTILENIFNQAGTPVEFNDWKNRQILTLHMIENVQFCLRAPKTTK